MSEAAELRIEGLWASAEGTEILRGVDLVVRSGEVHAVMGPNGSGKSTLSHVIAGRPGYEVTAGSITIDGADVLAMSPYERARAGLFLAMQYPTEVPGVSVAGMLEAAFQAAGRDPASVSPSLDIEADRISFDRRFLDRALNVDLSGGEKKRNETVQLGVIDPRIAILDELDSGLDLDALRDCANRIEAATEEGLGVLAITHYRRLLDHLDADRIHILIRGTIRDTGGPELATRLEDEGYAAWRTEEDAAAEKAATEPEEDPFADPIGAGPFAGEV